MRRWAFDLQRFLTSGTRNQQALQLAVDGCDDHLIKAHLREWPARNQKAFDRGRRLVADLAEQGFGSEAVVLQLVLLLPTLATAENAGALARKERHEFAEFLNDLTETCQNQAALQPSLAFITSLKGTFHRSIGALAAARAAFEEARDIHAELAEADLKTYQPCLAGDLNNLGNLYCSMKEFAAARIALEEARDLYTKLADGDPEIYQNDLASTLNNLGNLHCETKNFTAAHTAFEQARDLYARLADANPKTYQNDLAITLNNLGNLYWSRKEFAAARIAFEQARDIRLKLVESDPEIYQNHLATTLTNLGNLHSDTRNFDAARVAYEEARDIRRNLARADAKNYQHDLATTLTNLGNLYLNTKDFAAARLVYQETRDIYKELAVGDPEIYQNDLASAFNNLGLLHWHTREFAAARVAFEKAREIRQKLVQANPKAYENDLAITLNNLGLLYWHTRAFVAGRIAYEEARRIYAKLAKADPQTYESNLATTLTNLGNLHSDTRNLSAARLVYEEARDIRRKLAAADPETYQHDLGSILNNLGNLNWSIKDFAAARIAYLEARDIRRKLAEADPKAYQNDLAMTLTNLGTLHSDTKDFTAARLAYEEARDIRRKLAEADPETYQHDLTTTLNGLGVVYRETNDVVAARVAFEDAVRQAEAAHADHQRHLSKGEAAAAYRFLLAAAVHDPAAAFASAAAIRDGPARSGALGSHDLQATQRLLQHLGQRLDRSTVMLVPTQGQDDTVTLGMITESACQWWRMPSKGWPELFLNDARTADNRARHQLAQHLWSLLPGELQETVAPRLSTGPEILISGDSLWSAFPWELLRFGGSTDDYLGLHRALPRVGSILAPTLERTLAATQLGKDRLVAIVAPHTTGSTPLSGVEIEVEVLKCRLPELGGALVEKNSTGAAADEDLMRRAIDAEPDVLWYSGHGTIIANDEVLVLHSKSARGHHPQDKLTYFGGYQLSDIAHDKGLDVLFNKNPLIVLNSCRTGRTRGHGGQREDLVEAFMKHGAGAVIATALPIFDSVGEVLGQAMLSEAAILKPTIGESIVEVRRQLAAGICSDLDRPTWGAWGMVHLHGNSLAAGPFYKSNGVMNE